MPLSSDEFQATIIEGQKSLSKHMANMSGEISSIKNNSEKFEQEMRSYLESNPRTNQKGAMESISENTEDIKILKTDVSAVKDKVASMYKQLKSMATAPLVNE